MDEICSVSNFKVGELYSKNQIKAAFGVSDRGGIRCNKKQKHLVLLYNRYKHIYPDEWISENEILYHGTDAGSNGGD